MRSATSTSEQTDLAPPAVEEARVLARCEELVQRARKHGADEAEAYGSRSETIAARFEKGDLKLCQVDDGQSAGLRVFRERRLGFASTNQGDAGALDATARDALALSAAAPPHVANVLPAPRPIRKGLELVRAGVRGLTVDDVVDLGASLMARVRAADRRISVDNASCELTRTSHAIATSGGVRASESDALLSFSVFGMAIDGEDVGGFHYGGDALRDERAVEAALSAVLEEFTRVTVGNLAAERGASYRGPVLFAPDAVLELFVAPIVSGASAIAVQRGRSALKGKLGERIAVEGFDLADDPGDLGLAGAGSFDREGQPTERMAIVERGVLKSYLYNGYAAAVEGVRSTGHASGGTRSVPGLAPHALVVGAGSGGTRPDLERALGSGLFVQRFSGTVDATSGDFSGVAKSARWIEGGRVVRGVKEVLLSGNAFELLRSVIALSSVSERCSGSARAPYALVDGVSVTAG